MNGQINHEELNPIIPKLEPIIRLGTVCSYKNTGKKIEKLVYDSDTLELIKDMLIKINEIINYLNAESQKHR